MVGNWKSHFSDEMNYRFSEFCKSYSDLSREAGIPYGGLLLPSITKPELIDDLTPAMQTVTTEQERHRCLLEKVY